MKKTDAIKPKNTQRKPLKDVSFSVAARVAMQLGRESISSSITAVLELVKNAYDADADWVRIRFVTLRKCRLMVIEDNGDGMTAQALQDKWMVIGTDNKVVNRTSGIGKKTRVRTGEKGLGRLGLDRLCSQTRLQSKTKDAQLGIELRIDWRKYEKGGMRLEDVEHRLYSIPNLEFDPVSKQVTQYEKGTRLVLIGLKDNWNKTQIETLHRELSFLISPFGTPSNFSIEIKTDDENSELNGFIELPDEIPNRAYWRVVGKVNQDSSVEILMDSKQHKETYPLAQTPWKEFVKLMGETPLCGPLTFEFYYFARNKKSDNFRLDDDSIKKFLDINQGIRIYRDGIRVKPYGEPNGEGDLFRLAYRRMSNPKSIGQGSWRVGYNQVVGAISLTKDQNPELVDQTNREGLVEGEALRHLIGFGEKVIQFFETNATSHYKLTSKVSAHDDKNLLPLDAKDTLIQLKILENKLGKSSSPTEEKPKDLEIKSAIRRASELIRQNEAVIKQQEQDKNTMANLASLGILTASFGHETIGWTNVVVTNANLLKWHFDKGSFSILQVHEDQVITMLDYIKSQSSKIDTFAKFALGNIRQSKRKRGKVSLREVIEYIFDTFEKTFQHQQNIVTDISSIPAGKCEINAYQIDWESIFANLIANAAWAMQSTPAHLRKIRVQISEMPSTYEIRFEDSGHGLEAGTERAIFNAGFSTKRDHSGNTIGTGMGLFITKSLVEDNSGGTIKAIAKGQLGGASFVIEVPR